MPTRAHGWLSLLAVSFALVSACVCPQTTAEPPPPPPPQTVPSEPPPAEPVATEPAPGETVPTEPATEPAGDRSLLVPQSHPLYARVEGTHVNNACSTDAECHVGGCSSEVCSADPGVITTCEKRLFPSQGGSCGCVQGQCSWYRAGGDGTAEPTPDPVSEPAGGKPTGAALPGTGKPCTEDGRCAEGLSCVSYYGIAGPRGPKFTSCERRCGKGERCPDGQRCVTIADGPGAVCR